MNFIDGLNGLAAGVGPGCLPFLAFIAEQQGGWFVYFAALLLAAGLVGSCRSTSRARASSWATWAASSGLRARRAGVAASRFEGVAMSFLLCRCCSRGGAVRRRLHPAAPGAGGRAPAGRIAATCTRSPPGQGCGLGWWQASIGRWPPGAAWSARLLFVAAPSSLTHRGSAAAAGARAMDALRRSARPPRRARPLVRAGKPRSVRQSLARGAGCCFVRRSRPCVRRPRCRTQGRETPPRAKLCLTSGAGPHSGRARSGAPSDEDVHSPTGSGGGPRWAWREERRRHEQQADDAAPSGSRPIEACRRPPRLRARPGWPRGGASGAHHART